MNNNPKWLNDALRTGDKIIQEGRARDHARRRDRELIARLKAGESGADAPSSRATVRDTIDGIQALIAGAVSIVGLFVGANLGGWIGALALGAGGFVGTVFLFGYAEGKIEEMAEQRLWRQRPQDRTSADLKDYWEAKFGAQLHEELIDEIDMNGAAWVMDKNANFILRMTNGHRLFVGHKNGSADIRVEQRGGRGFEARDAYRMMLARLSAGSDSATPNGNKQVKAQMWAAAKLLGLKVKGYQPDADALEAHKRMQRDFAVPASVGQSGSATS